MTSGLAEYWESVCALILDKDQEKETTSAPSFRAKICKYFGVCVCGSGPESQPDALHFHDRLIAIMKHFMLVKDKTKPKTQQRILLEQRLLVFRLLPSGALENYVEADDGSLYFAIGYINFSTWRFCCLELKFYLQLADIVTLRASEDETHTHFSVRTSAQFFAALVDFSRQWSVQFFTVLNDTALLPQADMEPCFVDVAAFSSRHLFWRGSQEEANARKSTSRKKTTQSGRGRGRGKAKAKPQGMPKSRGRGRGARVHGALQDAAMTSAIGHGELPMDEPYSPSIASDDVDDASNVDDVDADASEPGTDFDLDVGQDDAEEDDDRGSIGSGSLASLLENAALEELVTEFDLQTGPDQMPAEPELPEQPQPVAEPLPKPSSAAKPPTVDEGEPASSSKDYRAGRQEKKGEVSIAIEDFGEIRYNKSGFMRAVCKTHSISGLVTCTRQRTTLGQVGGKGRPIGELVAWLRDGTNYATHIEHGKSEGKTYDQRCKEREWFFSLSGAEYFAEMHERKQGPNESEEPKKISKVRTRS